MKKSLFAFFVLLSVSLVVPSFARSTHVRGYSRKNGTHVQSHRRSGANRTKRDNYSTKGNTNPYTGKKGTKKADR